MKKSILLSLVIIFPYFTKGQIINDSDGFKWERFVENGYYGAKDSKGKILVPSDYESIKSLNGLFLVKKNDYYGLYSRKGKCILPAVHYMRIQTNEEIDSSPFILTGYTTWAAIDKSGRILVPEDDYESVAIVKDNSDEYYFRCYKNGFCAAYDIKGKPIILPDKYHRLYKTGNIKDGYFFNFTIYGGGSGVCNAEGKEIIKTKYKTTIKGKNSNNIDCYFIESGNDYGEMDLNGNIVKEPQICTKKVLETGMWTTSSLIYNYSFVCNKENKYGLDDRKGNTIIPYEFDWIRETNKKIIVYKGNYMGLYSLDGKCILPPIKYPYICPVDGGYIVVKKDGLWTILNNNGKELFPLDYESIDIMFSRCDSIILPRSKENNKLAIYDISGKQIIPFICDFAGFLMDPIIKDSIVSFIIGNSRKGIYSKEGKEIIPQIYTDYKYVKRKGISYYKVYDGNKVGIYDALGNIIIPATTFSVINMNDNKFVAKDGPRICEFDLMGNLISDNQKDVERDIWIINGDIEFENKHFKKAAQCYGEAIILKPSASLYYNRGVSYYNDNKYDKAINDFITCLEQNPSQNLIDKSKYLIRKSREFQAQKEEKRQSIVSNLLGIVFSTANAYIQSQTSNGGGYSDRSYLGDTNYDYLLDPSYAAKQVQNQNWNEYLISTNGGKTMSYEQWYSLKAQIINGTNKGTISSDEDINETIQEKESGGSTCSLCHGKKRIVYEPHAAQYGIDNNYKVQCKECGEITPRSWGHSHITCPQCHGRSR